MKQLSKLAATTLSLSLVVGSCTQAQTSSQTDTAAPLKKFSVVLDPGHGGADKGDDEKDSNLSLALQLRLELEKHGVQVVLTRSKDKFVSLQERVAVANTIKPDCFISLHGQREKGRPFSHILNYGNPDSVFLAQTIHNDLNKAFSPTFKGQIASTRYYVLRKPDVPSVMVTQNLDAFSTPEAQNKFVVALAEGIEHYAQAKQSPNKRVPILQDIPTIGQLFKSRPLIQQNPQSTTPSSPMLLKPPSTFTYLSAKSAN